MATFYVRTSSAGGDGTADTDSGTTAAYASLSLFEDARNGVLSEATTVYCSVGSGTAADTTAVAIAGWTASAANYLQVEAKSGEKASTKWSATKYRLEVANANALHLSAIDYVRVVGLQCGVTAMSANYQAPIYVNIVGASTDIRIDSCYLKVKEGLTSRAPALYVPSGAGIALKVWNTICETRSNSTHAYSCGITIVNAATVEIYNCTCIGGTYGINRVTSGTVTAKNTYGYGVTAGFTGTITTSYCASNTAELSGTGDVDSVAKATASGAYFADVSANDNADWAIGASSALCNVGAAPGGSAPLNYTVDINGATRTTNYDIGADEYVAAGASFLAAWVRPPLSMIGGR